VYFPYRYDFVQRVHTLRLSVVGGRVYDSALNGCQLRAWPCTVYIRTQEFCRTRRVRFVALAPFGRVRGLSRGGECAGMLTPREGFGFG